MNGNLFLLVAAFFPIVCAPVAWAMGRRGRAIQGMVASTAVEMALLLALAFAGMESVLAIDGFVGMGLRMKADGFRVLYACIACVMWLVTSIFGRDYLRHDHAPGRYAFFTLLTQGATVGLFLSDSLFTAFCFFEVMSMASYPWVAHEEEPEAMRAAETYLYIAVIGGLVMLMGIFLLPSGMATASYAQLPALAQGHNLWLAAALILVGFGAKAGAFPIHIWLPKAHPVAPATASALLSGMLTKAGVLGMLILTLYLMRGVTSFAALIFWLGVITMFLGALLAIFSTNLKRTLACSSLSQIGFIMVGVGTQGLCVCENGLAAFGTIQHMMNHSLFKLVLFLCAGIVAMNIHALRLDDVRGFGRKKPAMHFCFLLAAAGISGIPGLSGYISKSLLHEGLLEFIHELQHHGLNALPYQIAEWVFIISGGMTLCYMTKLYICLFWQKHPTRQAEFDGMTNYMSKPSAIALCVSASAVAALGLFPGVFMTGAGRLAQPFMNAADPVHMPIAYFSAENLIGALKSIVIGAALFVLQRRFVMEKGTYPERWPQWLDLENSVYRPLIGLLIALGGFFARLMDALGDGLAMTVRRLFLPQLTPRRLIPVGNRATYAVGQTMDRAASFWGRLTGRKTGGKTHYESLLAAGQHEAATEFKRFTRSISFGLFMFCMGLIATLVFLLVA
ncbi:MAG: complex I subunit 5 family protein [Clostridia bacterium]|nr:complex I subunit 5 family protein [Clostridia bacterium]